MVCKGIPGGSGISFVDAFEAGKMTHLKTADLLKKYDLDGDGIISSDGKNGDEVANMQKDHKNLGKSLFNDVKINRSYDGNNFLSSEVDVDNDGQRDFIGTNQGGCKSYYNDSADKSLSYGDMSKYGGWNLKGLTQEYERTEGEQGSPSRITARVYEHNTNKDIKFSIYQRMDGKPAQLSVKGNSYEMTYMSKFCNNGTYFYIPSEKTLGFPTIVDLATGKPLEGFEYAKVLMTYKED